MNKIEVFLQEGVNRQDRHDLLLKIMKFNRHDLLFQQKTINFN